MKNILVLILSFCCVLGMAQNKRGKADDAGRIALAAVLSDDIEGMPASAKKMLTNKLNRIASKYGMGGSALNERFVITANVQIETKDITSTAPPMHAYTLDVSFFIGDGIEGKLFSTLSLRVKGVGKTETKAYKAALKNIKTSNPQFKAFVDEGKGKILEFYNAKCDFLMKEADMMVSKGQYDAAIAKLIAVPDICKSCYDKAMNRVAPIIRQQMNAKAQSYLAKAQSEWSKGQNMEAANKAGQYLAKIGPSCNVYPQAQALSEQIAAKVAAINQQEYEFKLKKYEDDKNMAQQRLEMEKAELEAATEIAIAYMENQPEVVYEIDTWW